MNLEQIIPFARSSHADIILAIYKNFLPIRFKSLVTPADNEGGGTGGDWELLASAS